MHNSQHRLCSLSFHPSPFCRFFFVFRKTRAIMANNDFLMTLGETESDPFLRLSREKQAWRTRKPEGFSAKPMKDEKGAMDLLLWECIIPGKKGTAWEGGSYKLEMTFTRNYPAAPPIFKFKPPIFHPNVDASGNIYTRILDILNKWDPQTFFGDILLSIQNLLNEPVIAGEPNEACYLHKFNPNEYYKKVKSQALRMAMTNGH